MQRSRGSRNGWKWLGHGLQSLYGHLAGELHWIENPPKSMMLKWRGRDGFLAGTEEREARAQQIREVLPHLVCVIKLLDDQWAPEMAKLVRPKKAWGIVPAIGWAEAALRVLREAEDYLSVSEMLDAIVEEHDEVDLAEVGARRRREGVARAGEAVAQA